MGRTLINYTWVVCFLAVVGIRQVIGQITNGEDADKQLPSVVMINQVAIIEATQALKDILNKTQQDLEQQCETEDILVSMRNSLQRSESQQSALLNSSIEAWSALSEVPSTLAAIAQATDAYKPPACDDENRGVANRLDTLINAVENNSATTAIAIQALQNTTMQMMEVLQQTIQLQSDNNERMKAEINQAQGCCNGIQDQMENLVQVVTGIHKEMQGCREGSSCLMEGSNKNGILKPCDKKNRKRRSSSSSSCHLCCESGIGNVEFQNRSTDSVNIYTEPPRRVDVIDISVEPEEIVAAECCPSNFMIIGSECFYIAKELVSWFKARSKCEAMGGYIARPRDTSPLASYIMSYYENKRWYWIEESDLDQVSLDDENMVSEMDHNCHVFDAGQENNQSSLLPSSCAGTWYYICQHQVTEECSAMRNL